MMNRNDFNDLFSHLIIDFLRSYDVRYFIRYGNYKAVTRKQPSDHFCCCDCAGCPGPLYTDEEGKIIGCIPSYDPDKCECSEPTYTEVEYAVFYVYLQVQAGIFDKRKFDKRSLWLISQAKKLVSTKMMVQPFHPNLLKDLVHYVSYNDTVLYRELFPEEVDRTRCGQKLEMIITVRERFFEKLYEYLNFLPRDIVLLVLFYT